tara:strand:- start:685 stop:1044 length:360 start_codon:yes stop_codon:yes gene_type:complete
MSSEDYHEKEELLSAEGKDLHRAITSLMEELEAVDWYQQRIDATSENQLVAILQHNRDEEWEHAAMLIEWLRRHNPVFDRNLQTYLFTEGDIREKESVAIDEPDTGSLAIGSLKNGETL